MALISLRVVSTSIQVATAFGFSDPKGHGNRLVDSARTRLIKAQERRRERLNYLSLSTNLKSSSLDGSGKETGSGLLVVASLVGNDGGEMATSSQQKVYEMVSKQAALVKKEERTGEDADVRPETIVILGRSSLLNEAYNRCREVCSYYSKKYYLGSMLMTPERRRAIWAIYVWCRRTDELVDGPNALHTTPILLDEWDSRLENIFRGRPFDMLDTALSETVAKFSIHVEPFKDMIKGMKMDLTKTRYKNFDELYLYCYYVAGTVGLMTLPVIGIARECQASPESVYKTALALGVANQLTNILRDVGEDARMGRIYLPQDELALAGLSDEDIFAGKVTQNWRLFMKRQIRRARRFFDEAENGLVGFSEASCWPIWVVLLLNRQILDEIEANDYDNFTKRALVGKEKRMLTLPIAYARSIICLWKLDP